MSVVTLKQIRETGPSKQLWHRLEEHEENRKTVNYTLDALAVDLHIIVDDARAQQKKSWKGDSVGNSLDVLNDLRRKAKQAIELLDIYMGDLTFTEETVPAEDLEEATV